MFSRGLAAMHSNASVTKSSNNSAAVATPYRKNRLRLATDRLRIGPSFCQLVSLSHWRRINPACDASPPET